MKFMVLGSLRDCSHCDFVSRCLSLRKFILEIDSVDPHTLGLPIKEFNALFESKLAELRSLLTECEHIATDFPKV